MKLLSICLFLFLLHNVFALHGDKLIKLSENTLVMYTKFGFLPGGSVSKSFALNRLSNTEFFIYYLICEDKAKKEFIDDVKGENVCEYKNMEQLMSNCLYRHLVFTDINNQTKVLPYSSNQLIKQLSEQSSLNSWSAKQSTTTIYDYSADTFFSNLETTEAEIYKTGFTKGDSDQSTKMQAMDSILTSWLQYENHNQVQIGEVSEPSTAVLRQQLTNASDHSIETKGTYWFVLLNCNSQTLVDIEFTILNPNGEHLSAGEIENKEAYYVMIFLWSSLVVFWIATWILNIIQERKTYSLQYCFLLVGLLCLVFTLVEKAYWSEFSKTGYSPILLKVLGAFFRGIVFSFFLGLFLLIGKGYTYINLFLSRKDKRDIIFFVSIRFILSWLAEFFGSHFLIMICLIINYLVAFILIYKDFRRNLAKINFVLDSIQNIPAPPNGAAAVQIPNLPVAQNNEPIILEVNQNNIERNIQEDRFIQREPVRNFEIDIKMLKEKLKLVRWMRLFILIHIALLNIAQIISTFWIRDKPYIFTLWSQILLTITFFAITWFFNYKHKHAFIYSNFRGYDEDEDFQLENRQRRRKDFIELEEFYRIPGDFMFIQDAFGNKIQIGSKLKSKPVKKNEEPEKKPEKMSKRKRQKMLKAQKREEKYKVNESNHIDIPNFTDNFQVAQHKKVEQKENQCLNLDHIVLKLEESQVVEDHEISGLQEENFEREAIDRLYPKPKQMPPMDFRKNKLNGSFHN